MIPQFDAIGFAGGGNRCYWQSGFWLAAKKAGLPMPSFVVAVSAGAYHACLAMAGMTEQVVERALQWCDEPRPPDTDWSKLLQGKRPFAVADLYERLLRTVFDDAALAKLKAGREVLIQVCHPPRFLPGAVAAFSAIGAYQVEKLVTGAAHSKAGRYLGFEPAWVSSHKVQSPEELVQAILASSSVPPFMRVGRVSGRKALDGGLVDNPPLLKLNAVEAVGGKTLVLATRHGKQIAESAHRAVCGPSRPITVNKFSVKRRAELEAVFELGLEDGKAFMARFAG